MKTTLIQVECCPPAYSHRLNRPGQLASQPARTWGDMQILKKISFTFEYPSYNHHQLFQYHQHHVHLKLQQEKHWLSYLFQTMAFSD